MAQEVIKTLQQELQKDSLIMTPSEIFSFPVGTILKSGEFGGLRSYDCFYHRGHAHVMLDSERQTAVHDELAILYRGVPTSVTFHSPGEKVHRVGLTNELIVTVLGFSPKATTSGRKYSANWAFIDSVSGW